MTAPDEHPRVRVVTLNHNGGPLTLDCLAALRATEWPQDRLELVLVDNASRDGIADVVRRRWPEVRVIVSEENRGFAGGSNLGIGDVDDVEYVALVNNDVTVTPDWLQPLVETLRGDPSLGAACPKILFTARYLDVALRSSTARRGGGDRRLLGAYVSRVEADGVDVTNRVQWVEGFFGPEATDSGRGGQWAGGQALLRVPVARGAPPPRVLRLRLTGAAPGWASVEAGGEPTIRELSTTPDWFEVRVAGEPADIVNNVGSVLCEDGYGADRGFMERDVGQYDEPADVFAWCGAAVLLSAPYLRDVGLFDERLFLYYEDLELSWRGRERGWRYRYDPRSVVYHVHSASVGKVGGLALFYNERNRLAVLARHAPPSDAVRAAVRSVLVTGSYARRDIAGPVLRGERPSGAIVRGRLRAFGGYLRLLPAMIAERGRHRSDRHTHG